MHTGSRWWNRSTLWLAAAFVVLGAAARLFALGASSLTFDELFTVQMVAHSRSLTQLVRSVATGDAHPPLYYLISWVWLHLVGFASSGSYRPGIEFALRLPWALIGTASVALTGLVARSVFGSRIALVSSFLYALSPMAVDSDRVGRMYPLLVFLGLLSWLLLLRLLRRPSTTVWVVYVISVTLMLYTHYLALFVLLGQGVYAVAARTRSWRAIWAMATAVVLFSPWLPTLVTSIIQGRANTAFHEPVPLVMAHLGEWLLVEGNVSWPVLIGTTLAWGLVVVGLVRASVDGGTVRRFAISALLAPLGVWLFISATWMNLAGTRYLPVFLPYLLIVMAGSARVLARRRIAFAAAAALLGALLVFGAAQALLTPRSDDWRVLRTSLDTRVEPGDVVVASNRLSANLFGYYLVSDRAPRVPIITLHDPASYPLDRLLAAKRIWVITRSFGPWDPRNWTESQGKIFTAWYKAHTTVKDVVPVGRTGSVLVLAPATSPTGAE